MNFPHKNYCDVHPVQSFINHIINKHLFYPINDLHKPSFEYFNYDFSDEDGECEDILMYLSISPEVDNPDDLSGGEESVSTQNSERPTTGLSSRKRPDSPSIQSNGPLSKHSKSLDQTPSIPPTVSIHLPGAQSDEVGLLID